jgi:probable Rubsico expression protein CbbX
VEDAVAVDTPIDIGASLRASHIDALLDGLDRDLVGLAPVKQRIREISSLLLVARLRREAGLAAGTPTLHMSFTGAPGTGKTTVARRTAAILHDLGYVRRPTVVAASRDDLVGQFVGHTAPRTREVLKKAMGGVLFIDEADQLFRPENERDYGREAIDILMQTMENERADLVLILAGYGDRMKAFYHSNPGLRSRIAHHVEFPDFTIDELVAIAELMVREQEYVLDDESRDALREYLTLRVQQPLFANARSVRNAIDRARLRHANRLVSQSAPVTVLELSRLDATDFRRSRVFTDHETPAAPNATDPQPAGT